MCVRIYSSCVRAKYIIPNALFAFDVCVFEHRYAYGSRKKYCIHIQNGFYFILYQIEKCSLIRCL